MNAGSEWEFAGCVPSNVLFELDGINVWNYKWIDTGDRAHVKDPQYHQDFEFEVYQVKDAGRTVTFAAGEFSNGMWGFFVRKDVE